MTEETARIKACRKQCRIQKYIDGGTVFDGNCTCDGPEDCRFQLQKYVKDIEQRYWPDVIHFYRQLSTE
jgi:hypothetical protein